MRIKKKKYQNIYTMQDIKAQIITIVNNLVAKNYVYKNLPPEIDSYILEDILFNRGQAVWFQVGSTNVVLPSANAYELDIYGKPNKIRPIAFNGQPFNEYYIRNEFDWKTGKIKNQANAVLIMNNNQRISTYFFIQPIIDRLCVLWENLGLNACFQRVKALIECNTNVAKEIEQQMYDLLGDNKPIAIVKNKESTLPQINPVSFNYPNNQKDIWEDFDRTFNLLLTFCGVNNNDNDMKKERVIVDEVNANNEIIDRIYSVGFDFREKAIKEINEMFNLNITIERPQETIQEVKEPDEDKKDLED